MREATSVESSPASEARTFRACLATVLELPLDEVPQPPEGVDFVAWLARWLAGLGLGLVPVADPESFSWAGPWIARVQPSGQCERSAVVMYGVPSGVAWDPSGATDAEGSRLEDGFVVAALDIARARPAPTAPPSSPGSVDAIWIAVSAGERARPVDEVRALAGRGLEGDRHVSGKGTFPSGMPGSALTLIQAEVCESFSPPLDGNEHRRNVVTRGIDLNALVGHDFAIGEVRCRGMRLCEPCRVVDGYASQPVLRRLVHRGGLRADILNDGVIRRGDRIHVG